MSFKTFKKGEYFAWSNDVFLITDDCKIEFAPGCMSGGKYVQVASADDMDRSYDKAKQFAKRIARALNAERAVGR